MMNIYHGSNVDFNEFKIIKGNGYLAEGPGVYMTDLESVAKGYGSIIYTVDLSDTKVSDFTSREYMNQVYGLVSNDINIPLFECIDMDMVIEDILSGEGSILESPKELSDLIDANEFLYEKYGCMYDDLCEEIKKSFLNNIGDVIKYKAKDIEGTIFLCFRNVESIKIIDKKEIER